MPAAQVLQAGFGVLRCLTRWARSASVAVLEREMDSPVASGVFPQSRSWFLLSRIFEILMRAWPLCSGSVGHSMLTRIRPSTSLRRNNPYAVTSTSDSQCSGMEALSRSSRVCDNASESESFVTRCATFFGMAPMMCSNGFSVRPANPATVSIWPAFLATFHSAFIRTRDVLRVAFCGPEKCVLSPSSSIQAASKGGWSAPKLSHGLLSRSVRFAARARRKHASQTSIFLIMVTASAWVTVFMGLFEKCEP